MEQKEDIQLNRPARNFFQKRLRCDFSRVGFTFSGGELDVLAYDGKNRCFHVCEGKRASNIASVGHAIGQLIAYIAMIQNNGFDFLDRISKEEKLMFSDTSTFLDRKAIKICFYIVLPKDKKDKLLEPAKLVLSNIGDFGNSIGIFFASRNVCEPVIPAKPLNIKIRRKYNRNEFLREIVNRFFDSSKSRELIEQKTNFSHQIQIKKKDGNPGLHFEVCFKRKIKTERQKIEIGFHLEFAKAHLVHERTVERKEKIQKVLSKIASKLNKKGFDFKYERKWGKQWSRIYSIHKVEQDQLTDETLNKTLNLLKVLVWISKPLLDKIRWGRLR